MGGYKMIRVGVLTSSRADFGIYLPLLKALQKEEATVMFTAQIFHSKKLQKSHIN